MSSTKCHSQSLPHKMPQDTVITTKDLKLTSDRTYDNDGMRRRAACLCFRDRLEKEVLLITSTHDVSKWIVPGGGIDPGEEPQDAAEREAHEEAGATGTLGRFVGIFENKEKNIRTWVYAFYVENLQEHWSESKSLARRRQWFSLEEAKKMLSIHKTSQVQYILSVEKT
ncbi:diphosphoinositol polyphosphate phosphohydrolase 1 [Biomphalaria pfeifferi]|uniref:diphosphoinositol-polyphosphate diphosphatase n=1 Tax=Biomphalaria pfeifferi TaxID=112525 RepID=A0AAD8AUH0_BIOPF|nr:diphosphoinositol polyphosphate phosphohydrolase 1 [Biomphalaria pfeifferi]